MIHYSCDRCGRSIDTEDEIRYVVRMEVEAVMAPPGDESIGNDSNEHLMELDQILDLAEAAADPMVSESVYRRQRFDLCSACQRKFVADPLGVEDTTSFHFSSN